MSRPSPSHRGERWAAASAVALFAVMLVRTAWVCDDAYITFRTVDNVIAGFGPRWNVAERVQAYTHPLWMMILAAVDAAVRAIYFSSIGVSIAMSLAAVGLVAIRAATPFHALMAIGVLAGSKAFVDFSTSGLENPLSHLLVAALLIALSIGTASHAPTRALFVSSLLLVNRLDLLWFVAPPIVWWLLSQPAARRWRSLLIGLSPLIAWEAFSLIYYGFPIPNTAFAKLQTGFEQSRLLLQGLRYFEDSWRRDPLTLIVVAASIAAGVARGRLWRAVAIGQTLHLAYLVWAGGDFMSGRHLTVPLLAGVMSLSTVAVRPAPIVRAASVTAVMLAHLLADVPNVLSGPGFGAGEPYAEFHGITDERRYYYPRTGLLRAGDPWKPPVIIEARVAQVMLDAGQTVATRDAIGMFGYAAGPRLHIVDRFGLSDPLLARLPASPTSRIGHFWRELPEGYIQTLRTGQNQIRDEAIARYYDALVLITRGPVFSWHRLRAIVAANLHRSPQAARWASPGR